jgi:hypothetical protein
MQGGLQWNWTSEQSVFKSWKKVKEMRVRETK